MKLASYQREIITAGRLFGILMMLWRRQAGKTTTFAWQALRWMLETPGVLVTFASCSLALGSEMTERETQLLLQIIEMIRGDVDPKAAQVTSNADGLEWYDIADLYQHNKLEVSLFHDRTRRSRTKIIAANYATARGYSGYVLLDEVGFIRDFKAFFEAIEPVFSRNPDYRLWMATTPPEDDAHFSYELSAYPPGREFIPNACGTWYENDSGIPIHRVDAWDAELAGIHLYDSKSRQAITPEAHRAKALDKVAWDRNYGLTFTQGGISAVGLLALQQAQAKGVAAGCIFVEDDLPPGWESVLDPAATTTVGADPATTDKERSNPFAITILQEIDGMKMAKIVFRFRSADPVKCRAYLEEIARTCKPRIIVIDATSERFWAAETKTAIEPGTYVELVDSSTRTEYLGESMTMKTYLGNLLVNAIDDRVLALPPDKAIKDDFRLVQRFKGGFNNALDNSGHHGDTFDSTKQALYGFELDGFKVEATAVQVGGANAEKTPGRQSTRMAMYADEETPNSKSSYRG